MVLCWNDRIDRKLDRNGDKVGARLAEALPTSVQNQLSTRSGTENQCDCTDTRVCLCQKNKEFFEILSKSHTKYGHLCS